jgi:hypothetical protein
MRRFAMHGPQAMQGGGGLCGSDGLEGGAIRLANMPCELPVAKPVCANNKRGA